MAKFIDDPINSIFEYEGVKLKVEEIKDFRFCTRCYFANHGPSCYLHKHACTPTNRKDKAQVIFKKINNV